MGRGSGRHSNAPCRHRGAEWRQQRRRLHGQPRFKLLRASRWGDRLGSDGISVERLRDEDPHGFRFMEREDGPATRDLVFYEDRKPRLWGDMQEEEFARLKRADSDHCDNDGTELRLFGRRRLQSLNSWMHNSERLTRGYEPTLQLHPGDALQYGVVDGQPVRVTSACNQIIVKAEITDEVMKGSVCYPHGYGHSGGWQRANGLGGGNVNLLASDNPGDWEQVSGICLLDGIPVRIERA